MNRLAAILRGEEWNDLDEQSHLLVMSDTTEGLDKYDEVPVTDELHHSVLLMERNLELKNALVKEVNHLEKLCISLEGKRQTLDEEARKFHEAQRSNEEKIRQQKEMLDAALSSAKIPSSENQECVLALARFEKWSGFFDENEATQTFDLIYQDLRRWVGRHCLNFSCANVPNDAQKINDSQNSESRPTSDEHHPDLLHDIQGEIFECIFISILAPFMLGTSSVSFDHHLRIVDKEVQEICPFYVWQHWRSALSSATKSLEEENLKKIRNEIVNHFEIKFGQLSVTKSGDRQKQLSQIINKCVTFKQKLESQGGPFYFWWSTPGVPWREEYMVNITGECPTNTTNQTVRRTLWPMLYKQSPGKWVVLVKERVLVDLQSSNGSQSPNSIQEEGPVL